MGQLANPMGANSLAEKNLFAQGQMQTFIVPENLYKLLEHYPQ